MLVLVLTACAAAGLIGERLGLPAPFLLASLLVGAACAVSVKRPPKLPTGLYTMSQALVGAIMGSYLMPRQLHAVAPSIGPLLSVTAGTVLLSLIGARILSRRGYMTGRSAILGLAPGGSAAIVATAVAVGADARTVAFAQYLRVAMVAVSAPVVVQMFTGHSGAMTPHGTDLSWAPHSAAGLTVLVLVAAGGVLAGRLARIPTPALLGPMLVGGAVTLSGSSIHFAPHGLLADAVFIVIGAEVGLRFTRESLVHARKVAWPLVTATVAVSLGCAGLACALARLTRISPVDAYLATTPGGINAVLSAAVATHANVPLISSVQSLRLFIVVLATPPLLRLMRTVLDRTPTAV